MKTRKFIQLMTVFALVLLTASLATSHVRAAQEVTLTALTHDQLYIDYFKSRLAEWEKSQPDYKFTYDFRVDSQAPTTILQSLAAGEQIPDLVGIEQGAFPNYMKDGTIAKYFLDLTDRIGDRRKDYAEGRWALYSYQGKIYAIESSLTASVYYYQPKIFKDNGVDVPKTWEDMLKNADVLGKKKIAQTVATNDANWFAMLFFQRGGLVFDKDGKFVFGDEPNRSLAIEVATYIKKGIDAGVFLQVLGNDHWSGVTIPTAYKEGRLAGQVMPDWWSSCCLQPGAKDMTGQWAVAPMPVWAKGGHKSTVWGGTGWAVSSQSPHAELAWKFLDFMYMGKESQIQRFEKINMFPTMFDAMKDPRVAEKADPFYGGQKVGEMFAAAGQDIPVWYQSPFRAAWSTEIGADLPQLFDGTLTPDAFVDKAISVTKDAVSAG